jgi:predicted enzyme related to lactoylglutathione lyase
MGRVVRFEIPADDLDRAERFYTRVFAWKAQTFGNPDYRLLTTPHPSLTTPAGHP